MYIYYKSGAVNLSEDLTYSSFDLQLADNNQLWAMNHTTHAAL